MIMHAVGDNNSRNQCVHI